MTRAVSFTPAYIDATTLSGASWTVAVTATAPMLMVFIDSTSDVAIEVSFEDTASTAACYLLPGKGRAFDFAANNQQGPLVVSVRKKQGGATPGAGTLVTVDGFG